MTLRDCYKITWHTIKGNKYRSILTVIISMFLSALIMGMVCLALSFSNNVEDVFKNSYFSDNSFVSIDYQNIKSKVLKTHKVFDSSSFKEFSEIVAKYEDVVDTIEYTPKLEFPGSSHNEIFPTIMTLVDSSFPISNGIEIVKGRNIQKSEEMDEVILSEDFLEGYGFELGETVYENMHYTVLDESGVQQFKVATIKMTIVGFFKQTDETQIINNSSEAKDYNIIGDIGIAFNSYHDEIYISNFRILHHTDEAKNTESKILKLKELSAELKEFVPKALETGRFEGEITERYYDSVTCEIEEKYNQNKLVRSIVSIGSIAFAVVLMLMSIGSLANSVIISIDRSKKFIGLLKALGMRGGSLILIEVFEAITLISTGVILGYGLLFALYNPLKIVLTQVIIASFSSYLNIETFVGALSLPIYVFLGSLVSFIILTFLFSRGSLYKIAKTDPIRVINEVS